MAQRYFDNEISRDGIKYGITDNGTLVVTNGRNAKFTTVGIPEQINGMPVVEVEESAFSNSRIKIVTLPKTVVKIGNHAFSNSINLKQAVFYADNVQIGRSAFSGCFKLTEVSGNKLQTMSDCTFWQCKNLVKINAEFAGDVYSKTFGQCKRLEDIQFADGVKLHTDVFYGCRSVKTLYFATKADIPVSIMKFVEKRQVVCNENSPLAELAYTGTDVILAKVD